MNTPTTADDILPLLAKLSKQERIRLIQLISSQPDFEDASAYAVAPVRHDEFSSDDDSLAWEGEGWEEFS